MMSPVNLLSPPCRTRMPAVAAALLLACCLLPAGRPAFAQAGASSPPIDMQVTQIDGGGELIEVAVNKAAMVKFNQPVSDAHVIEQEICSLTAVAPEQLIVTGKAYGTTQLIVQLDDGTRHVFDVAVDLDLERLSASIRHTVPQAKVEARSLNGAIVLTGTCPDAMAAEKIAEISAIFSANVINHIEIAGSQQVLLRCTVAEVNRSAMRALGFNGWVAGENFPSMFGASNLGGINPTSFGARAGTVVSPPQALGSASANPTAGIIPFEITDPGVPLSPTTTLTVGFPMLPMQVFVRALRENGMLRVLAEPNLVAISGQEARFLAGGRFPIPVPQGNDSIAIQFEEFGVELVFTPAVLNEGQIRLMVAPSISEPDFSTAVQIGGVFVPGVAERRVSTVVEVGSGQTIAIGGLLSERVRGATQRVPGLGDLPILGPLFTSVEYQSEETELVVLITPELVGGIGPQQVTHVPGATMSEPNDFELYLEGKLEGSNPDQRARLQPHVNRVWQTSPQSEQYGATTAMKVRGPIGPASSDEGL